MKEDKIENLIEKYKAGASTLNEEQFLFDNAKNTEPTIEAWSTFVKGNKNEAPENFNNTLWDSFQKRKTKKRKIMMRIMSAAASILVILAFFIGNPTQKELSYKEKEAFLNEARNMFANAEPVQPQQSIIYENDLIIIYTSSE